MARCMDCLFFGADGSLQRCNHPQMAISLFGFDLPEEIDCDAFENAAFSHESVVDRVVHENIELFFFGGR